MKLIDNAGDVLRRAWSVKLMLLAAVLSGVEAVLPFFAPQDVSLGWSALTFAVVACALVARFIAQPKPQAKSHKSRQKGGAS
jgi:membrane associated rhomboid family serine protease